MARWLTTYALAAAGVAATAATAAAQSPVQAGVLKCRGAPMMRYIVGSSCSHRPQGRNPAMREFCIARASMSALPKNRR